MTASYAWTITKDKVEDGLHVGTEGPSDAPDTFGDDWHFRKFRMYDDDGELYYEGVLCAADPDSEEAAFGPLDDFGTPNAGCTRIDHFNGREWETI